MKKKRKLAAQELFWRGKFGDDWPAAPASVQSCLLPAVGPPTATAAGGIFANAPVSLAHTCSPGPLLVASHRRSAPGSAAPFACLSC